MPQGEIHLPLWVDYADDPKMIEAGEKAELLYIRAACLMKRTMSDGFIAENQLPRFGLSGVRARAARLVDVELWERVDGGYVAPAFLKRNKSREQIQAESEEKTAAGVKGNHVRWHAGDPRPDCALCLAEGIAPAIAELIALPITVRSPESESKSEPLQLTSQTGLDDVRLVFDAWVLSTGKTGATVLSEKRRKVINNALKMFSLEDVLAAVTGWRYSEFHAGKNERKTVYNDIELLLRDAKQVELFRDLARGQPAVNGSAGRTDWEALYEREGP